LLIILIRELELLKNLKVIIALKKIAFDKILSIYNVKYEFKYLAIYKLPDNKILIAITLALEIQTRI